MGIVQNACLHKGGAAHDQRFSRLVVHDKGLWGGRVLISGRRRAMHLNLRNQVSGADQTNGLLPRVWPPSWPP
jgi:hypothetical protein